MATVRFSDELKRSIRNSATGMFAARIDRAVNNIPEVWAGNIYDLAFGDNVAKMNALPDGYLTKVKGVSLRGFKGEGWDENMNYTLHLNFPGNETRRMAVGIEDISAHGFVVTGYGGWTLDAHDDRWDTIKAEYKLYCEAIRKLESERDRFVAGVDKVVETYATLGPALKAWPALWDLIPEGVKERHREVVVRTAAKKAAEIAEEVDLDSLTGLVTASKLTR